MGYLEKDNIICMFAFLLVIGQFGVILLSHTNDKVKFFDKNLTVAEKDMYKKVINERMSIYLKGTLLGLILAFIILFCVMGQKQFYNNCLFSLVILLTQFFYYMLEDKKFSMITVLTTSEKRKLWKEVSQIYMYNYYVSILIGIAGYMIVSFMFCKKLNI